MDAPSYPIVYRIHQPFTNSTVLPIWGTPINEGGCGVIASRLVVQTHWPVARPLNDGRSVGPGQPPLQFTPFHRGSNDAGRGRDISLVPPDRAHDTTVSHTNLGGEIPSVSAPLALGAKKNPGRRGGESRPAGSPGNASSEYILREEELMSTTYNGYDLIGYLGGKGIYRHPTRGLAIERDHGRSHPYLVGMTAKETEAWETQLFDMAMIARLENEKLRANALFTVFQEARPCS